MIGETDYKMMRRCLELAVKAQGMTYPNPVVGSIIVCDGKIIGEGYHLRAGEPHAEVNAINSVKDKSLLTRSTIYVSLEPCSHTGKTPPCADLIIKCGIPSVVIGTVDTSDKVSGKGISKLKESGCNVFTGVLDKESRAVNSRFFTYHERRRPYIVLKWAQSADGFIDGERTGKNKLPVKITGETERVLVHKWRSEEQAILVGGQTIRADKPSLNVRNWKGNDPVKMVLSGSGNLNGYLSENKNKSRVIVFSYQKVDGNENMFNVLLDNSKPSCRQIVDHMYKERIQSIFIEGGAQTINHFIENGLWDEARIFTGRISLGNGIKAPYISGKTAAEKEFEQSRLKILLNE
jgi:diaminohydroxyphosphoribosylaminopyrimidine deaminase / 5-amino-6-(5-phosphoribosylamino)uracil reductase